MLIVCVVMTIMIMLGSFCAMPPPIQTCTYGTSRASVPLPHPPNFPCARTDVLVYFSSEDDRSNAYFPKFVVVIGLTMVCLSVLMLPLDVANRPTSTYEGGGFDMELLWNIMYVFQGLMAILIIPSSLFYYEAEDPESREYRCWTAIKYEVTTVFTIGTAWIILWKVFGIAKVRRRPCAPP